MAHERSFLPGMTDYTGVPIDDILRHLEDWRRSADSAIENIKHGIQKVKAQSSFFENPGEVISFGNYFVDLFSRYHHDLDRLIIELPRGITQAHVEIVEQLYKSSKHEELLTVEFKNDWISKSLPNEEVRPILDHIYADARDLLIGFRDLSNLLPRLKTFVGAPPISEVLPELHLKPNIFGMGINLNRVLARIKNWWSNK